jgi:glutamate--cysteine ligase
MKPTDAITTDTDFTSYFAAAGKSVSDWAIGAEIEIFGFTSDALERITPAQVQAVLEGFAANAAETQAEDGFIVEATLPDQSRITLEPGGQIEFSGAPQKSLSEIEQALTNYFSRLQELGEKLGIIFVATGFDPLRKIDEQHWIPKQRYEIMRPYLAERGRKAWDMMCRTSAIQVNLDYCNLEDLAKKFTLANRLAPVAASVFANSPFADGKLSGYKTTRYAAWLETDADRTGAAACAIDGDFSVARFVEYVKQVPMFFIRRENELLGLAGYDFKRFLESGFAGQTPILQDFTDHLSTIFTEARLKPHIEQRSMDCGNLEMVMAAMAFWKGLLYDKETLNQALEIAPKMNCQEYKALQLEVAKQGLQAKLNEISVKDLAKQAVTLARSGLQKMATHEAKYLDILEQYVCREEICPADILMKNFSGRWHGDIRKAVKHLSIADCRLQIAG